jgi:hypothetical protein
MNPLRVVLATALLLVVLPQSASATVWCVPNYFACPRADGDVQTTNVEFAMNNFRNDGQPDFIHIGSNHTYTDSNSIQPAGSDPLKVIGKGSSSVLTTSANTNSFVVNLNGANAAITLRRLKIMIPSSFPDGLGSALQMDSDDALEDVDIESRNPGSKGISSMINGGVYRGGTVFGTNGGSITNGVKLNQGGTAVIDGVTFMDTSLPVVTENADEEADIRNSTFINPLNAAAVATAGKITIRNSLITTLDGQALKAFATSSATGILEADHVTAVRVGGNGGPEAIHSRVNAGAAGSAFVTVSNSIFRGYAAGWQRQAPVGAATGDANLTIKYSNILPTGNSTGDGTLTATEGLIDADPLFAGADDYHLSAGSPSIDTGDPAAGTDLPDLDAKPRVLDGTNDCDVRRDMGAYEFQLGECDAPVVSGTAGNASFATGGDAVVVDPGIAISDADGDVVTGVVSITDPEPGDELLYETTGGVVGLVDDAKTSVTFSGGPYAPATLAAAMSAVRYRATQAAPAASNRTVSFKANDGKLDSNAWTRPISVDGGAVDPGSGGGEPGGGGEEPGAGEPGGGGEEPGGADAPGGGGETAGIKLLRVKRHKNATATLTLRVTGAGLIQVQDRKKRIRKLKRKVGGPRKVNVKLKLRKGKPRKVTALVRFTPKAGEPTGFRLKLKFRRARR